MAAKRCPNCQLVNPGKAQRCDCGYSFQTETIGAPLDLGKPGTPMQQAAQQSPYAARILIYIVLIAIGVVIKLALRH